MTNEQIKSIQFSLDCLRREEEEAAVALRKVRTRRYERVAEIQDLCDHQLGNGKTAWSGSSVDMVCDICGILG